jgi:glucose-6-phosphate isomerase
MKTSLDIRDLKKNCNKKNIRLKDMKDSYRNPNVKGNPLIYTVYIKNLGGFKQGLTVIEPGTINKEFYMTRGHRHIKPEDEIYILVNGTGKLILQTKKAKIFNLGKNRVYFISSKSGHRLVNTGRKKLEILAFYPKNAGHNYNIKFKKRFFKKYDNTCQF